jgi:hypothetical protein
MADEISADGGGSTGDEAAPAGTDPSFEEALAASIAETGGDEEGTAEGEAALTDDEKAEGGEDAVAEKPKADEPKKPESEATVSEKNRKEFAALARERGKLNERRADIEAREKRIAAEIEPQAKAFQDVRRRIHEDPHGLLLEAGGEALVDKFLDQCQQRIKSPAEQEIAKLRQEREQEKAQLKAQEDARITREWEQGIVAHVEKAGDASDLIRSFGRHDAVIATVAAYHAKYGVLLDTDIAIKVIEDDLEAGGKKSKKFGSREAVKPAQVSTGKPPPDQKKKKSNTTLSSVASGSVPAGSNADDGPEDEDERFKWALRNAG